MIGLGNWNNQIIEKKKDSTNVTDPKSSTVEMAKSVFKIA